MHIKYRCDGVLDCANGFDENNTTCNRMPQIHSFSCPYINQFKCRRTDQCIREAFKCDGQMDCYDGSDEENCPELKCSVEQFRCNDSSKCIPLKFVCDSHTDCPDGSDERGCCKFLR